MKNIEIKAKCVDLDALRKRIKNAGGRYVFGMFMEIHPNGVIMGFGEWVC